MKQARSLLKEFEQGIRNKNHDNEPDIQRLIAFLKSYNSKYRGQREEEANNILSKILLSWHTD